MKNYSEVTLGIACMLASAFFFALMNGCVKMLAPNMEAVETIFFRAVVMVALMLGFYALTQFWGKLRRENASKNMDKNADFENLNSEISEFKAFVPQDFSQKFKNFMQKNKRQYKAGGWLKLLSRSFWGGASMLALFFNIHEISLGVASTFHQTMPIFIVIISMLFLREKPSFAVLIFTLIGFAGIVLISDPQLNSVPFRNICIGIFSGFGMALAFISLRSLRDYFGSNVIVLTFGVLLTLGALCALLVQELWLEMGIWVNPSASDWAVILAMGLFGTFGQQFLTKAYIYAPAGIVAPIDYSRVVFSLFLGVILGDALPNLSTSLGIVLVIASGVLIGLPVLLRDIRAMRK